MFIIKCNKILRPISIIQRNILTMNNQSEPNNKQNKRPQSGQKHRHSNRKSGLQKQGQNRHYRHMNKISTESGSKWPSDEHKCIILYHDNDNLPLEEVQKLVSQFGTVKNAKRKFLRDIIMSVIEMSSAAEAEKAFRELCKSRPSMIQNVMPDTQNKTIFSYEPYWSNEALRKGVSDGSLLQGIIRVNPKKYQWSYISDGKNQDIFLSTIEARNRALPGDRVAVKLRDSSEGTNEKVDCGEQGLVESVEKLQIDNPTRSTNQKVPQKTGDVVGILEKIHTRICVGILNHMLNHEDVVYSPCDHGIPRLIIPKEQVPREFLSRPKDFKNKLFMAKLLDWGETENYARGELCQFIGNSGEIEPETTRILLEHGVAFSDFPPTINDSLPKDLPWKIPEAEYGKRKDLRSECIFTIDPATAKDLDDALHCRKIGDDLYEVGVHIADVSYFVKPKTEVDNIAAARCTSVYLVQRVIPMLPTLLCEELCSLNPGQDRLTYSVIWKITGDGRIVDEWFGRTVIHSCTKLSYDHAQSFIDATENEDLNVEEYPLIDGDHKLETIREKVNGLFKISQNLRKRRYDDGALRLDQIRLAYTLDKETGMPNSCFTYEYKQSNELIEEFMLLANIAVAHKLHRSLPEHAFLRCHPEPKEDMLKSISTYCEGNDLKLDTSSAKSLASSLRAAAGDDDLAEYRLCGLQMLAIKPQELAIYFCTGCVDDQEKYQHYALNVPLYTHFTSPIRRYADLIVHRQLSAALGDTEDVEKANLLPSDLQKQADECNLRKSNSKKVQDLSVQLFFCELVKSVGVLESEAIVLYIYDQSFDILSLKYGQIYRVYLDSLPIVGSKQTNNEKELQLLWPCDNTERYRLTEDERRRSKEGNLKMPKYSETVTQTIKFFSVVDSVFEMGPQPLQVKAFIRRKADSEEPSF